MQKTLALALVVSILAGASRPLFAQSEEDADPNSSAAYFAITTTPVGALPTVVAAQVAGARGVGLRGQFGYIDEDGPLSRRVYGVGLDIPVARSTLGVTAGFLDFACDEDDLDLGFGGLAIECKGGFMGGASWATPVVRTAGAGSAEFMMGVEGSVGFSGGDVVEARFSDGAPSSDLELSATSIAAALGLPFAVVARTGGVAVVPYLTPRLAYGLATIKMRSSDPDVVDGEDSDTDSGSRFMLGGGFGVLFDRAGIGLTLGFQKVFIDDGKMLIGAGITWAVR